MMTKVALVLSGGGFRGAFQVGVLKYLKENWNKINPHSDEMRFNIVVGSSVGSLNGALVASNNFNELENFWNDIGEKGVEEIYTSMFIDTKSKEDHLKMKVDFDVLKQTLFPNFTLHMPLWAKMKLIFSSKNRDAFLKQTFAVLEKEIKTNMEKLKSIADNTPLKNKLLSILKRSDFKDCLYRCGSVSLNTGNYYSFAPDDFNTDEDFANAVLASTSMPIVWPPVEEITTIQGKNYDLVDGGVRNITPLGDAIDKIKPEEAEDYLIIVVNCTRGELQVEDFKTKGVASIAMRALYDITLNEIFMNDIRGFLDKNYIVQQIRQSAPGLTIYEYDYKNKKTGYPILYFKNIIIQPGEVDLGDSLVANKKLIDLRISHGFEQAEKAVQEYELTNPNVVKLIKNA